MRKYPTQRFRKTNSNTIISLAQCLRVSQNNIFLEYWRNLESYKQNESSSIWIDVSKNNSAIAIISPVELHRLTP